MRMRTWRTRTYRTCLSEIGAAVTSSLHHTSLASMPAAGRADWVDGWGLRCALPLDAATGC
eukprot:scaffold142112_cov329-Phaeocystis_antarctica.AAC.1